MSLTKWAQLRAHCAWRVALNRSQGLWEVFYELKCMERAPSSQRASRAAWKHSSPNKKSILLPWRRTKRFEFHREPENRHLREVEHSSCKWEAGCDLPFGSCSVLRQYCSLWRTLFCLIQHVRGKWGRRAPPRLLEWPTDSWIDAVRVLCSARWEDLYCGIEQSE